MDLWIKLQNSTVSRDDVIPLEIMDYFQPFAIEILDFFHCFISLVYCCNFKTIDFNQWNIRFVCQHWNDSFRRFRDWNGRLLLRICTYRMLNIATWCMLNVATYHKRKCEIVRWAWSWYINSLCARRMQMHMKTCIDRISNSASNWIECIDRFSSSDGQKYTR